LILTFGPTVYVANTARPGKKVWQWQTEANVPKIAQKDTDARWTKKNGESHFGYKDHVKVDEKSKIITEYTVTDASVHDSQETEPLVDDSDKGKPLYADSAYAGAPIAMALEKIGGRTRFTNALKRINRSPGRFDRRGLSDL